MSIVTGRKKKFVVKDFISEEWAVIRGKLHKLGFLIFENAENNEVTLVHDVECAAASAVEGNYTGVESDALQAARVLLNTHPAQEDVKPVEPVVETKPDISTKVEVTGNTGTQETREGTQTSAKEETVSNKEVKSEEVAQPSTKKDDIV